MDVSYIIQNPNGLNEGCRRSQRSIVRIRSTLASNTRDSAITTAAANVIEPAHTARSIHPPGIAAPAVKLQQAIRPRRYQIPNHLVPRRTTSASGVPLACSRTRRRAIVDCGVCSRFSNNAHSRLDGWSRLRRVVVPSRGPCCG